MDAGRILNAAIVFGGGVAGGLFMTIFTEDVTAVVLSTIASGVVTYFFQKNENKIKEALARRRRKDN
jgi:uncharacterized membrane protein YjjP (DUF1212 family)